MIFLLGSLKTVCHEGDTLDVKDFPELDMQELMQLAVDISSTKSLNVFNTPSTVTVISREMIESYNFLSLAEAINTVAGMDVLQTIIDRNVSTSRGVLQNFYANKILLMINGVATWQPVYGEGYIERIDINDVERIEILKGPASVLYGSNAYNGVVNIILRNRNEGGVEAYGRYGYKDYYSAGFNWGYIDGEFSSFVSLNSYSEKKNPYEFEGHSDVLYKDDSVFLYHEYDQINNFNVNMNYGDHSFLLNGFMYEHSYLGQDPSYYGGAGRGVLNRGILANYNFERNLSEDFHIKSNFTYDYFRRVFPLSYDYYKLIDLSGDRKKAEFVVDYDCTENFYFEFGADFENRKSYGHDTKDGIKDTLIMHNLNNNKDINEWNAFTQIGYRSTLFNAVAGVRYTNNSHFGDNIASRLSAVLKITDNQSLKLMLGESFRVPTIFELYFIHPSVLGNSKLKPEKNLTYEIAYLQRIGDFYYQILTYHTINNDLIFRSTPDETGVSVYENLKKSQGYGLEAELKFMNEDIAESYINYTFVRGHYQDDYNYRFVPDHKIAFGLSKRFYKFKVSVNGIWYSKVQGHLEEIPPQYTIDLNLCYKQLLNQINIMHVVSVKNINGSEMLLPEYIRQTPNINSIPAMGFGTRVIYTLRAAI